MQPLISQPTLRFGNEPIVAAFVVVYLVIARPVAGMLLTQAMPGP